MCHRDARTRSGLLEIQVLEQGSLRGCREPSAGCIGRIAKAQCLGPRFAIFVVSSFELGVLGLLRVTQLSSVMPRRSAHVTEDALQATGSCVAQHTATIGGVSFCEAPSTDELSAFAEQNSIGSCLRYRFRSCVGQCWPHARTYALWSPCDSSIVKIWGGRFTLLVDMSGLSFLCLMIWAGIVWHRLSRSRKPALRLYVLLRCERVEALSGFGLCCVPAFDASAPPRCASVFVLFGCAPDWVGLLASAEATVQHPSYTRRTFQSMQKGHSSCLSGSLARRSLCLSSSLTPSYGFIAPRTTCLWCSSGHAVCGASAQKSTILWLDLRISRIAGPYSQFSIGLRLRTSTVGFSLAARL